LPEGIDTGIGNTFTAKKMNTFQQYFFKIKTGLFALSWVRDSVQMASIWPTASVAFGLEL